MKGMMAEEIIYAKSYFWVFIEYMYNCHESGELKRCNYSIKGIEFIIELKLHFNK